MNTTTRPRYASYLPASYEATDGTVLDRLIEIYETLMSGRSDLERRLFESRADLAMLDPVLIPLITEQRDVSYDTTSNELVYDGEMTASRRDELQTLPDDPTITPANKAAYLTAVESLFSLSWRRAAPRRLLETWVELGVGTMTDALRTTIAGFTDCRFEATTRRLVFSGSMSIVRRDQLKQLGTGAGLTGSALTDWQDAIARLFMRTREREEEIPGLEHLLDNIQRISDPFATPAPRFDSAYGDRGFFDGDFVSFLASWVALSVRQEWPEAKKRRLVSSIVPIYKKRGTLDGIRTLLEIYVESPVTITEELGMQVGVRSTIRVDTRIGGLPHQFRVEIPYGFREPDSTATPIDFVGLRRVTDAVLEVLDLEKPVYTDYTLGYRFPGIIVREYSTVGMDTLIWDGVLDVSRNKSN